MIGQPAQQDPAHNHYYTLQAGKVKVYPSVFRHKGKNTGQKVARTPYRLLRR